MSRSQSTPDIYRVTVTRASPKSLDEELLELCNLSGVTLDNDVFKILLDLIKLNVSPTALVSVLKKIAATKGFRGESQSPPLTTRSSSDSIQTGFSTSSVATSASSSSGTRSGRPPISSRLRELKSHALKQ